MEVKIPNLYHLRNRALIKELIQWNPVGNFDRVLSLVQLMLYREEKIVLYQGELKRQTNTTKGMESDEYWEKNYPGRKESSKLFLKTSNTLPFLNTSFRPS